MYRRTLPRLVSAIVALAFVSATWSMVRAQEPDLSNLAKALAVGDTAAQIQATDDIADLGPRARTLVPALVKLLGSSDAQTQWHAARALSTMGSVAKDAVPALTAALRSGDANVRGYSAFALQRIGTASQSAVPALTTLLSDKDRNVRRAAIEALISIQPNPRALVPLLKQAIENSDMDPTVAVPALNALANLGDAGIQVLIDELKHEKARYWACVALAEAGPKAKAAVPDLTRLIQHQDPEIRMQAIIALGEIGPDATSAAPLLVKALGDEHNSVRYAAAFAVGKLGSKEAIAELAKNWDASDRFLRMVSAWALAKIQPNDSATVDRAVALLVESLKDGDKHVRAAAARGLYELRLPPEKLGPAMADLLADKDPVVRSNVVAALTTLGEKALPRLNTALENDEAQSLAVAVIRQLGPKAKDAVPTLIKELADPNADHRQEVEFALAAIGPDAKGATMALVQKLSDDDPRVRYTACYALGKIGPAAAEAVPVLRDTLKTDDKFLKVATMWALMRIQPEDKPLRALAVPLLIKAMEESDRELVKIEVAGALGSIGPTAKEAIPVLEKTIKETESAEVRAAAEDALKKVRQAK